MPAKLAIFRYRQLMPLPTPTELVTLFAILFAFFRALEFVQPKHRRTPLLRPGLATDIAYWIFNPIIGEFIIRTGLFVALGTIAYLHYGRLDETDIRNGFGPLSELPIVAQVPLMLVIGDFLGYWSHRLFHRPALWRFHAIHHAPTTLDWLSAARTHPVNELAGRLFSMCVLLLMGFKLEALAWAGPLFALYALFLHANLDWDYGSLRAVLASPRFHRWHHTSEEEGLDKNFAAILPLWDIMFGTYYMPKDRVPERFGTDTKVPPGLMAQLAFPFRRDRIDPPQV